MQIYGCFQKNGTSTPKSSILIGFSIINHPFWGTPIFGNIHMEILRGPFPPYSALFGVVMTNDPSER